jgi:DNA polymerase I-like protein with 3'-5' exonuclease and polymerase domains
MENNTQGTAASILRWAARGAVLERDLPVVFHVHDELVLDVPKRGRERIKSQLHEVMNTTPPWAAGLPLKADVDEMTRYGK